VTSRETLGIYGETLFNVGSMSSRNADSEGVQLFLQSARRAGASIALDDATLSQILQICDLIEGLPLAIELAASWVRALPLTTIIDELKQGLDILETRTGSVRRAFDKSWHLLTSEERLAFASLGVFRGGFTHEAAETVTSVSWRMLTSLVDKSLVWRTDENRYAMHELLRQYALEKLPTVTDPQIVHTRHCTYYAGLADAWGAALRGGDQITGLAVIEAEFENIRRSWHTAIQNQDADALYRLLNMWFYFEIRSRWHEAHELFEIALAHWPPDDSPALAKLLAVLGTFTWRLGQWDESEALATRSMEMSLRLGDEAATVHPRLTLGNIASMRGDYTDGRRIYEANFELARKYDDRFNQSLMLTNLGIVNRWLGETERSYDILQQLLTISIENKDHMGQVFALTNLSKTLRQLKQPDQAEAFLAQSLPIARTIGQQYMLASATSDLGQIAHTRGDYQTAEQLTRQSIALNRKHGHQEQLGQNLLRLGQLLSEQGNIPGAAQCLHEGLDILANFNTVGYVLNGLAHGAELLMRQVDVALAVAVLALVRDHASSEQETRDRLQRLLDELQAELPPDLMTEATERGKQLDWEGAHQLIMDKLRVLLPQA
jgi:tetratricopeptide (TPR) repeat protein